MSLTQSLTLVRKSGQTNLTNTLGFISGAGNYAVNLEHHAGKLLKVNFDHFSREAHAAYVAGHYLAMKKANEAHAEYMKSRVKEGSGGDRVVKMAGAETDEYASMKSLIRDALILNGMADHFMTDMFAAGHARTPRFELFAQCGMTTGGLYSNAQHDEENQRGVIMKNKKNEMWLALGDKRLWDYANRDNRAKAHQAAKASLKEVAQCFQQGCPDDFLATNLPLGALEIAPDLEWMLSKVAEGEPPPMFLLDDRCPTSGRAPTTDTTNALKGCNCLLADSNLFFRDEKSTIPTASGGATVHLNNCIWMPKIWRRTEECTMDHTFKEHTFLTHRFGDTTDGDACA